MKSILCLAALFALAWGNFATAESSVKSLRPVIPPVQAPTTNFSDGSKLITLDSYRGRNVILNVWATWCGPCVKEMPSLDRLSTKMAKENLVVIAVSQDNGGKTQVKPFLDKLKIEHVTVLYDHGQKAMRDFGIRGLPTTFLISPEGRIVARLEGDAEWDNHKIIKQIKELYTKNAKQIKDKMSID
jgi:thiol-disulfide isomerase/thioredoxin